MSVVVITGCSTGIGLATAIHLAKSGHKVYATMRNPANSVLPEIVREELLPIDILSLDVNSDDSVDKAIKQVLDQEGFIDVLVNNAGVGAAGSVEELPIEAFRADMETNYFGTLRCIRAVLPFMRERRKGTIINNSSVSGKIYNVYQGSYAPSKAAVEALSEVLAQEVLNYGIRVALVEPGVIETPIFSKADVQEQTRYPIGKRLLALFAASLENHISPIEVAKVIADIVEGRSQKFRNPAGPDAAPLLMWRASQTDEEYIGIAGIDDETWIKATEEGMNLPVRKYMENPSLIDFGAAAAVPVKS